MIKKIFILFSIIILNSIINLCIYGEAASIVVNASSDEGAVNRKVFGNNLLGFDPAIYKQNSRHHYAYSDYGAGIWDPEKHAPDIEVIQLAREAGITVLRFPGGCGAHNYNWKKAIGSGREHNLFGIDEFIETSKAIGAEPVITISYFVGNEEDAADLVEYLNAPDDGRYKWAKERAKNGHKTPYGVKYFEFDNEAWHGNHLTYKTLDPEEYAKKYLLYREKMKAVDPSIKLGVVLLNIGYKKKGWDRTVVNIVKDKGDFFITHSYPPHFSNKKLHEKVDMKSLFELSLAYPVIEDQEEFDEIKELINKVSPKDKNNIAVTEFNGYFVQNDPVPYRHSLGNALINAELIKSFMDPKNNILMANYWNFCNEYWGMVSNGFKGEAKDLYKPYFKRPNYYVFEMYAKHFGDILIKSDVQCDFYYVRGSKIPYLSVNTSKTSDGNTIFLMVINKNINKVENSAIELTGFLPKKADIWTLSGMSVDSTNESDHYNVKVTHKQFEITGNKFSYTFEPHSLTAIELTGKGDK